MVLPLFFSASLRLLDWTSKGTFPSAGLARSGFCLKPNKHLSQFFHGRFSVPVYVCLDMYFSLVLIALQALSPQPTDLILKPNILAGDRRRAMDSAQLFLSSVKTVLIAKCAQSMPKSAGVSSQASRTVGQELLNFSPLARFLWNIL